jgi:competence protein ComEA
MYRNSSPTRAAMVAVLAATALALGAAGGASAAEPSVSGVVNVNTASEQELQLLPGVGEARARAIVEARKEKGGFKSVDELEHVKGIGDAGLERLRPFVTLTGQTTARPQ